MQTVTCDVLVVGASLGGCAAALRAAAMGASVCLLQESDWVGGQLTEQGVNTPDENRWVEVGGATASYQRLRTECRAYYGPKLSEAGRASQPLNIGENWVSGIAVEPKIADVILKAWLDAEPRIRRIPGTVAKAAERNGDRIYAVVAADDAGNETRFEAAYVLDATDTGELLPLTGVRWVIGGESREQTDEQFAYLRAHPDWVQPITFPFAVEFRPGESHVIPKPAGYEAVRDAQGFAEEHRPGGSFKGAFDPYQGWWTYRRTICAKFFADPAYPHDVAMINTGANDYKGDIYPTGDAAHDARTLAAARHVSLCYLYWLQTECPRDDGGVGYPELTPRADYFGDDFIAKAPYIRESRRILAHKTILDEDLLISISPGPRALHYPDSCGIGHYHMDLHERGVEERLPDSYPRLWVNTWPFQIPLSALIPRDASNLIAACKNIGTTHLTNGAYRLHPIEWNIGEAAGALAAFCVAGAVSPLDVTASAASWQLERNYQDALLDAGVPLYWWGDVPPSHPHFKAIQRMGMDGHFAGFDDIDFRPDEPITADQRTVINQRVGRALPWPGDIHTRAEAAAWLHTYIESDQS